MASNILTPDEAMALKSKGNELFINRQFPEASKQYSRIIDEYGLKIPPDFEKVILCNRAACDIELGRYSKAVGDLKSVLFNTDGIPASTVSRAHFRLARCYFELNSYDDAKAQMESYDKSMDSTTISVSQPAVTKLKREINDKRNEMKNKGKKPEMSLSSAPSNKPPRPITYEAKVLGPDVISIFLTDLAPACLCVRQPPERHMHDFMLSVVERHYDDIFFTRPFWSCWVCGDHAQTMLHLPAPYLHLPSPLIVDLIRPVCGRTGGCKSERHMDYIERMLERFIL